MFYPSLVDVACKILFVNIYIYHCRSVYCTWSFCRLKQFINMTKIVILNFSIVNQCIRQVKLSKSVRGTFFGCISSLLYFSNLVWLQQLPQLGLCPGCTFARIPLTQAGVQGAKSKQKRCGYQALPISYVYEIDPFSSSFYLRIICIVLKPQCTKA